MDIHFFPKAEFSQKPLLNVDFLAKWDFFFLAFWFIWSWSKNEKKGISAMWFFFYLTKIPCFHEAICQESQICELWTKRHFSHDNFFTIVVKNWKNQKFVRKKIILVLGGGDKVRMRGVFTTKAPLFHSKISWLGVVPKFYLLWWATPPRVGASISQTSSINLGEPLTMNFLTKMWVYSVKWQ